MKCSQMAKGLRARKRDVACTWLDGSAFTCDLRILNGEEEKTVLAAACKGAREAGGEPVESDLSWQFAFACQVVALAVVDSETSESEPAPFFDGGAEQVRLTLDRERILLLSHIQRQFQEAVSPRVHDLTPEQYISKVAEAAKPEDGAASPFDRWPRSTLESFARSMAAQLWISLMPKLPSSSESEPSVEN